VLKRKLNQYFKNIWVKLFTFFNFKTINRFTKSLTINQIMMIAYLFLFFLFTGGIMNSILEGSNPVYLSRFIVPGLRVQNILEVFFHLLAGTIGIVGIYLMYLSRKQFEKRIETFYLFLGLIIFILGMIISIYIVEIKIGRIG